MTIKPISPDQIETFTIVTNPPRSFSSSSAGITGSIYVFARRSDSEKETGPLPAFRDTTKNDASLDVYQQTLASLAKSTSNISSGVLGYLSGVNAQSTSARKQKYLEILRFTPSYTFTSNTVRKLLVKDSLMPYYRPTCPSYNYAFTNYHSLNFFTASSVNSDAVVLFPGPSGVSSTSHASGAYMPTGSLSFDFYIKPRYTSDSPGGNFKAGTVFHLSSTYAVSLVTGSSRDVNGYADGYRILLQLSHSADIAPSLAVPGTKPYDLVFMSDDNSLKKDRWHHVIIRWGTSAVDQGTGSFIVDGVVAGNFCIPSSTIAPAPFANSSNPDVLCIGNFYQGNNKDLNSMVTWFATDPATRDGLYEALPSTGIEGPDGTYLFQHPLNAEVHDLLIREGFVTNDDVVTGSGKGPTNLNDALFYWPPFFTKESPTRKFVGSFGGVLESPFYTVDGTTVDPFNIALSFGVAGHYVNLENFGRDFAGGVFPRWLHMTASEISVTTDAESANDFFYATGSVRRRNLTILPCDDGNFVPNYDIITNFSSSTEKYRDDVGALDMSLITLKDLLPLTSAYHSLQADSGSFFDSIAGASPESYGLSPGQVMTIFQRTRDNSSNEVALFDISNLFYGNRILPGSFTLTDSNISGSSGKVSITLKDDGYGNLYRADCITSQSAWNSVGNVFYNEGIVIVKTPMIPFFGKDQFNISFKGEQNIHTMRVNAFAEAGTLNSSSNPSYFPVSASFTANRENQEFVYVTGLMFHDDDLNVVMKTQLAQPVIKRTSDKLLFRVKIDM